ncbi:hypothetical protein L4C33_20805 [Vibrio makurazakiensis]|uniref:hypothetical protein n=1 Tax=Vibrio makurazakiensis TaxID=2910250 RepID=UPI003D0AB9AB
MDSKHQFDISFSSERIDKDGVHGERFRLPNSEKELVDYVLPYALGYGYFPSAFWGVEARYSIAQDQITSDAFDSAVQLDSLQLGIVVRQPYRNFLFYTKTGINYYEGYEFVLDKVDFSVNQGKFYGVRPYIGIGVSAFYPVFNWGHEIEIGGGYTYKTFERGYSISSLTATIGYHFF